MNPVQIRAFGEELAKNADLSPALLGLLAGGAGGGLAGHQLTDDPRKKWRNALLAALAGAGGGAILGSEIAGPGTPAAPAAPLPPIRV